MNQSLVRQVWIRAKQRCEYCRLPSSAYPLPFHVDHIIARQHGGQTSLENLALSCLHCNRHKGPNIAGRHSATGELIRLFSPRQDIWEMHFDWQGAELVGLTSVAHVTIQVLAMNEPDFLALRRALMTENAHLFR